MELSGQSWIEDVAGLFERREAVGVENFRPQIAVIGGRIAAGKDVLEMGSTVTQGDRVGHADSLQLLPLERDHIDIRRRWIEVKPEIDKRRGRIFDRGPTLIEAARVEKLADEHLRDRLAGLVMEREPAQHFGLFDPV